MSTYYYVRCESKANLLLALTQVLGPFWGCDDDDLKRDLTGAYFSPIERMGVCILNCDDDEENIKSWCDEIDTARTDENAIKIDKLKDGVKTKNTFIIDAIGCDDDFMRNRIEEVISITYGIKVQNNKILEKTFESEFIPQRPISDEIFSYQSKMVKKCADVLDIPTIKEIAAMENPKRRQVNLAYSLAMYTGFTNGRKNIIVPALSNNKELQSILSTINKWYVTKYPEFYVRADHMGDRINLNSFVTYCFGNGACSLKHIISCFDDFNASYSNMLVAGNYDVSKHLKGIKELLNAIDEFKEI